MRGDSAKALALLLKPVGGCGTFGWLVTAPFLAGLMKEVLLEQKLQNSTNV